MGLDRHLLCGSELEGWEPADIPHSYREYDRYEVSVGNIVGKKSEFHMVGLTSLPATP